MDKITNNYNQIHNWAEWLEQAALAYKSHAGKHTFIDDLMVNGCAKDFKRLSRLLYQKAREIQEDLNKGKPDD